MPKRKRSDFLTAWRSAMGASSAESFTRPSERGRAIDALIERTRPSESESEIGFVGAHAPGPVASMPNPYARKSRLYASTGEVVPQSDFWVNKFAVPAKERRKAQRITAESLTQAAAEFAKCAGYARDTRNHRDNGAEAAKVMEEIRRKDAAAGRETQLF